MNKEFKLSNALSYMFDIKGNCKGIHLLVVVNEGGSCSVVTLGFIIHDAGNRET
jgi:hypothetical protein